MQVLDERTRLRACGAVGHRHRASWRPVWTRSCPICAERKQFGQPIGSFQLMQGKIADMYTAMNSARAYVYEVAKACDRGEVTRQDAAACVLYASEEGMTVAHQAVQAMGGAGFMSDTPVSRIFRDAKLMEIGAGTSEIRRMLIGRELVGAMQ